MKKKRRSIVQKVSWILVCTSALSFACGCFTLNRLEKSNIEYIYRLTGELLGDSIEELESQIEAIQDILYGLVVSDEIQEAGSFLLQEGTENATALQQASGLNRIVDVIQNGIRTERAIVCANFLYRDADVRVAASTRYYLLSEEAAAGVSEKAVEAQGKTIFLDGEKLTGEENVLILAKQVREKRNLSMRHIGVIVLFIDMEELGKGLTEFDDGIFILQEQIGELEYVLNDEKEILDGTEPDRPSGEGYCISRIKGEKWFVVEFDQMGGFFSYTVLVPYSELFADVRQTFGMYVGIFLLCSAAALSIAFFLTFRVTKEIKQFIQHISRIPGEDLTKLPLYERKDIRDSEVYALQEAFNSMSVRIKELVQENYMKQLLVKETQLKALQSQMNPHFLYNTLNSLYWMARTAKMDTAADMISSLGILLREAISDKEFVITIDRELDIVCHYLIIQKHRYEERLKVIFKISGECSSLVIPRFVIQPLVENAIAYGLECMLDTCRITIRIFIREGDCICQVRNTGPEPEADLMRKLEEGNIQPRGNGIGLMNIQQRVQFVFGGEYGVDIFREGDETVAQIRIKCISAQDYGGAGTEGGTPLWKKHTD